MPNLTHRNEELGQPMPPIKIADQQESVGTSLMNKLLLGPIAPRTRSKIVSHNVPVSVRAVQQLRINYLIAEGIADCSHLWGNGQTNIVR